jgi:predicted XRE-type DNA-binding protein
MATRGAKTTRIKVERSSGNVFADLGFPNPELERFKATLMLHIHRIITARKLTQVEARKVLGIRQANVSRLMHGSTGSFSVERLIEFLSALGHDVEVVVTPTRKKRGALPQISPNQGGDRWIRLSRRGTSAWRSSMGFVRSSAASVGGAQLCRFPRGTAKSSRSVWPIWRQIPVPAVRGMPCSLA